MTELALDVVLAPVAELRENPSNPRVITDPRFAQLLRSIEDDPEMLAARPLIALMDGTVIAGNMRLRAVQELGWEQVPTVYVDLDDERAKLWLLRDNNEFGEWAPDELAALIAELDSAGTDLALTGFAEDELTELLARLDPVQRIHGTGEELETFNATMGDPEHEVERGDVWQVGRHRLVCAALIDGWPAWAPLLTPGCLFVPYPSPMLPLSERADADELLLLCPDPWLAGHVLDRYREARPDEAPVKL